MTGVDWGYACLSLLAALTVGLAVGCASHWAIGLVLSIGWCLVHALVEGVKDSAGIAEEVQLELELMR
jgi:hypothetical protein